MNALNSILIEGNIVRDPVLKETPKGTPVCNFSIASNRFYRQDDQLEQETSFFEVESWAKLAETCGKTLAKGRGVRVVGVAPGLIERPGLAEDWPDGHGRWSQTVPLGRPVTPDEVAAAVVFLASRAASGVTGTTLVVDAGWSAAPGW